MAQENIHRGTCLFMCPLKETKWREKNKLLHAFEIKSGTEKDPKADPDKTVKQYSRSAAGKIQASAADLRPSSILLKTVNYLVNNIVMLDSVPWIDIYNYVNDRLQAVRQDITIQGIEDNNCVIIYEKCVRFYIISSYILCEETQLKFDQYLNNQQLSICIEKLINLYQKFRSNVMNEIISIHYILNVVNYEVFYRSDIIFKSFLKDKLIKLTTATCISWVEGNFIKFFALVKKLPVLLQIAFSHHFGFIRKRALKCLNTAYSCTSCKFPIDVLSLWLCITNKDMLHFCEIHTVKADDKNIYFNKKVFNDNTTISYSKKEYIIEQNLRNIDLSDLINGKIEVKK